MIHEYQVVIRQNGVGNFVLEINLYNSDVGKCVNILVHRLTREN